MLHVLSEILLLSLEGISYNLMVYAASNTSTQYVLNTYFEVRTVEQ